MRHQDRSQQQPRAMAVAGSELFSLEHFSRRSLDITLRRYRRRKTPLPRDPRIALTSSGARIRHDLRQYALLRSAAITVAPSRRQDRVGDLENA